MADQRSVEMLAFNFSGRTFPYKRLAQGQGLSRSVSAFSSFMREYLDTVIKADQCAQYVDDIRIAANTATDLTRNVRAVFKCIRRTGLKLIIKKCLFGVKQILGVVDSQGKTISPEGISSQARKSHNFLDNLSFPNWKKLYSGTWDSWNITQIMFPECLQNLLYSINCLKWKYQSILRQNWNKHLIQSKKLSDACQLALKQPIPGKQLVPMTDASFRNAGYTLMIEDNPDQKIQSKRKTYASVAFGSKNFSPAQLDVHILKNFWQSTWLFSSLHTSCGKEQSQQLFWQTTIRYTFFPKKGSSASTAEFM